MSKKISVIMASHLGQYPGAATNRIEKFKRAVYSFIKQDYPDKELIIVSDGCVKTVNEALEIKKSAPKEISITIAMIQQTKTFSGLLRNYGIGLATGDIICYLDTDDIFLPGHLSQIASGFGDNDWIYFDDLIAKSSDLKTYQERFSNLNFGGIGTSCIAHRKTINASWSDGYGHDFIFIKELEQNHPNYTKLKTAGGYLVCHVNDLIDY